MTNQPMAISQNKESPVYPEIQLYTGRRLLVGLTILCVLSLSAIWVLQKLMDPETLPIKNVRVEGEFVNLKPEALKSSVSNVVRGGFFNVNVDVIHKVLFNDPWVEQVAVLRIWPDSLNVKVKEQVAVAQWKNTGLLNENAKFFSPDPQTYPRDLPLLSGPENTYGLLLERYNYIERQVARLGIGVRELTLSERHAWEFVTTNGIYVTLGRNLLEIRINRFVEYAYPNLVQNMDRISRIDMRYTNGFAVQWKTGDENIDKPERDNYG